MPSKERHFGIQRALLPSVLAVSALLFNSSEGFLTLMPSAIQTPESVASQKIGEIANFMLEYQQPIDYKTILASKPNARVLFLGPEISRITDKYAIKEVVDNFKQLRALGFTDFATPIINTDQQSDLDAYLDKGDGRETLIVGLPWNILSEQESQMHLNMLKEAKKAGFQVWAIAANHGFFTDSEKEGKLVKTPLDISPENKLVVFGTARQDRVVRLKEEKIAYLNVMINGFDESIYSLLGFCGFDENKDKLPPVNVILRAAGKAGLGGKSFMVSMGPNKRNFEGFVNWNIHAGASAKD